MGLNGADGREALDAAFLPKSVAVVGVPRSQKLGKLFFDAQKDPGFRGPVYPINPNADEIDGVKAYPTVSAVGEPVDYAIICTHPDGVPDVLRDCAAAGVKTAAIFSSGFGELGEEEGDRRNEVLLAAVAETGVRVIGPNCMGVYSPEVGLAISPNMPARLGDVAFVSQSGSLTTMFATEAIKAGFATSKAVSMGNQMDLGAADFIHYLADDDQTKVITTYIEGPRDGRAFFEAVRYAGERKPVVLWKAGRTAGGAKAAASHTGALRGERAVWDGLARQTGAVPVRSLDEVVDRTVALRMRPVLTGRRMLVVTGPGGPSVSAVDALEDAGLTLAVLAESTIDRMREMIAAYGTSPRNPVDVGMTMMFGPEVMLDIAEAAATDPGVDGVLLIGMPLVGPGALDFLQSAATRRDRIGKPMAAISFGQIPDAEAMARAGELGIGVFLTAERAVQAMAAAGAYVEFRTGSGLAASW